MHKKTLAKWLRTYRAGVERQKIKQALSDLRMAYPEIDFLPAYDKAKALFEFLKPRVKDDPKEEPGKKILILPPQIKGYLKGNSGLHDLLGTGWGNCFVLSLLYTILAKELDLDCNFYFVNIKEHYVCYALIGSQKILIDLANGMFSTDNKGLRRFLESRYNFGKNAFLVEDEFLAMWARIMSLEDSNKRADLKEAASLCTKFIGKYPGYFVCLYKGAAFFLKLGEYKLALKWIDAALKIEFKSEEVLKLKADILFSMKDYLKAAFFYDAAYKLNLAEAKLAQLRELAKSMCEKAVDAKK